MAPSLPSRTDNVSHARKATLLGSGSSDRTSIRNGVSYILKDHKDARHVLLVADKEHRIKFIEEHYNLSTDKATRVVSTEEKKRTVLYRKFGKEDYDQPVHYHMVLNMNKTDLHTAVKLMCRLVTSK